MNYKVAIAGNPNAGKTTLFNAITGSSQKIANYPGVTVEKKSKIITLERDQEVEFKVEFIDLPGCYSINAISQEECIAHDSLLGRIDSSPDLVICVLDSSNLERNLYLASQLIEFNFPIIIALNMIDSAEQKGLSINYLKLAEALDCPVVPIIASKNQGTKLLLDRVKQELSSPQKLVYKKRPWQLEAKLENKISILKEQLKQSPRIQNSVLEEQLEAELFWQLSGDKDHIDPSIQEELSNLNSENIDLSGKIIEARYQWIRSCYNQCVSESKLSNSSNFSDKIDNILTHKIFGPLSFIFIFWLLFQLLFSWSDPFIGLLESGQSWLSEQFVQWIPAGILQDFIVQGVIGGVGNVVVFLPQILFLFAFLSLLEESGYIARAAFILDRIMSSVGLHGRAFIPLLSSFACAIPGIMAARTIENQKDRLITILIAPLMTCSARLPVYVLLISALFPHEHKIAGLFSVGALLLFGLYFLAIFAALLMAFIFKKTLLKSPKAALVLEMPPYRLPVLKNVGIKMYNSGKAFLKEAGKIIFISSVILWALLSFPKIDKNKIDLSQIPETQHSNYIEAQQIQQSFGGQLGQIIEPVFEPLGFDWRISIGIIGSFAAREVLISTLGLVYAVGSDVDEESQSLREVLKNHKDPITQKKSFTPLIGLSLLIFYVFACQCISTLAIVKRETQSWKWPLFLFTYMTALAYLLSFVVFQLGSYLGYS